jgi:predicted nucleic acid-binding protein
MRPVTHVLDTSAILAHYFKEPGAEIVARLWSGGSDRAAISAVTVAELKIRLLRETEDTMEAADALDSYLNELTVCLPVDRALAELAWQLRLATPGRLPLVDAIIAATARSVGAILVHKDPHLSQVPAGVLEQIAL